ncbi:MAG: hypothetical protein GF355_02020 [Candidatus Eisenbacteria bacterium]|nr:hypothetical protein [Candidatus Eisenbacteria bacterium]
MPPFLKLTDRDTDILEVLLECVPLLSIDQIARTWWKRRRRAQEAAHGRLRLLEREAFVDLCVVVASPPELLPEDPHVVWRPGDPCPDHWSLRQYAREYPGGPLVEIPCVVLSEGGARLLSPAPEIRPRVQTWDDGSYSLRLAELYLRLQARSPSVASTWRHRERTRRSNELSVPVARVRSRGRFQTLDVFSPNLDTPDPDPGLDEGTRLEWLHSHCLRFGIPYAWWGY